TVDARYRVADDGHISFKFGKYDRSHPLVIDPTITYSTYLGGRRDDLAYGIAVDSAGNVFVAGTTASSNFPIQNAYNSRLGGNSDAFVTKLNAAGNQLVYSTYLGGTTGPDPNSGGNDSAE